MILRRLVPFVSVLVLSACGSKAPDPADAPAAADAAPTATTAPTAPTATTATTEATVEDAGVTTVPPTIEADVAAPEDTAPASAAVEEDVAAPVEEVAAVADDDVGVAAVGGGIEIPGVDPAVVAKLSSGEPGCVGFAKGGRAVLSIVEGQVGSGNARELRLTDLGVDGGADTPVALVADIGTAEVVAQIRALKPTPCQTVVGEGRLTIPKSVPIEVQAHDAQIDVFIAGNQPVVVSARTEMNFERRVVGAYWAEDVGYVVLRTLILDEDTDARVPPLDKLETTVIKPSDLGVPECVGRPVSGDPAPAAAAPAFDPAPARASCVAMTADGTMAAFKTFYMDERGDNRPNALVWAGAGTAPDIDLSCMARSCNTEQKAAITEAAARLGLVGCAPVKGGINLDGFKTPFMYQDDAMKLKTATGWRVVHRFAPAGDELGKEAMWGMFQHPAGGPVFLYVGYDGGPVNAAMVKVLDEGAMKLCPKGPANLVKVAEVKAVSAAKDGGGYKFGAMQLVDGDPTTSWQPAAGAAPAWVEVVLAGEEEVAAVEIANGFQRKDGNGDMFALNGRAAEATLVFSDGSSEKVSFGADERGFKRFAFAPRKTTSVKVTIDALHDGARWAKDLALSEIRVLRPE